MSWRARHGRLRAWPELGGSVCGSESAAPSEPAPDGGKVGRGSFSPLWCHLLSVLGTSGPVVGCLPCRMAGPRFRVGGRVEKV